MTLTEIFAFNAIHIDFGSEIMYSSDQAYVSYPQRFPVVEFQLIATSELCEIADRVRKELGMKPMHPMDEYTDETCDQGGWYDFYIGINGFGRDYNCDSGITFYVVNSDEPDNESSYTIDLEGYEQEFVYALLDKQCRRHLGKGCGELLDEARAEMEENNG